MPCSGTETVIEALRFSARLRLPKALDDATVDAIVDEALDLLELRGKTRRPQWFFASFTMCPCCFVSSSQ